MKGQGVLYTLTLPSPSSSRATSVKKTSAALASDWERFRRSMRGDEPLPKETQTVKESSEDGIFAELEKSGKNPLLYGAALLESWWKSTRGTVVWKGRAYAAKTP